MGHRDILVIGAERAEPAEARATTARDALRRGAAPKIDVGH